MKAERLTHSFGGKMELKQVEPAKEKKSLADRSDGGDTKISQKASSSPNAT